MKNLIAVVASVFINVGALIVIGAGIAQSGTPHGQVFVTELAGDLPALAQADHAVHSL